MTKVKDLEVGDSPRWSAQANPITCSLKAGNPSGLWSAEAREGWPERRTWLALRVGEGNLEPRNVRRVQNQEKAGRRVLPRASRKEP